LFAGWDGAGGFFVGFRRGLIGRFGLLVTFCLLGGLGGRRGFLRR
jgi:hypothetical protein